jgi:hypothetical protein
MQVQHKAGKFWASDFFTQFFPNKKDIVIYVYRFTRPEYNYNNKNQQDWLKAGGVTFESLLKPKQNTVMLGWRYNLDLNKVQAAPYLHNDNGDVLKVDGNPHYGLFTFTPDQEVIQIIKKENEGVRVVTALIQDFQTNSLIEKSDFVENIKTSTWSRPIAAYGGGDEPIPASARFNRTEITLEQLLASNYAYLLNQA